MITAEDIKKIVIFKGLTGEQLDSLAELFSPLELPTGSLVFSQGDPGDSFYIIKQGKLDVIIDTEKGPVTVATLREGQGFGEMALMHNDPRNATIKANEPCFLGMLDQADFLELLGTNPSLAVKLNFLIAQRVKEDKNVLKTEVEKESRVNVIPFKLVLNKTRADEARKKFFSGMGFLNLLSTYQLSRCKPSLRGSLKTRATDEKEFFRFEGGASVGPREPDSLLRSLAGAGLLASEILRLTPLFQKLRRELDSIRLHSTPMAHDHLNNIQKGLDQAGRFIDHLGPYFKLGHLRLSRRNLIPFLINLTDRWKNQEFSRPLNLNFDAKESDLPPISFDERMIERVFEEILKNSLFMAPKVCELGIEVKPLTQDNRVKMVISNNAPPIDGESQKKLFHPFFTTAHRDGVGLGLSLAKKIMVAHGGDLELLSSTPRGNQFLITIPLRPGVTHENH